MAKDCPRGSCTGERGSETALCLGEKSTGQGEVGATSAEALRLWSVRLNGIQLDPAHHSQGKQQ